MITPREATQQSSGQGDAYRVSTRSPSSFTNRPSSFTRSFICGDHVAFPGSVPPRMARICAGSVPTLRSPRMNPGGTENSPNGSSITSPRLPLPLPRPGTQLPNPQPPPRPRSGGASDLLRRPFHHLAVYLAVGGAFATDHQHTRLRVEFQCLAHIAIDDDGEYGGYAAHG